MAEKQLGKVNYSAITSDVLVQIQKGHIYEIVRNKRPEGIFLIPRPGTPEELQELVNLLSKTLGFDLK